MKRPETSNRTPVLVTINEKNKWRQKDFLSICITKAVELSFEQQQKTHLDKLDELHLILIYRAPSVDSLPQALLKQLARPRQPCGT